MSNFNLIIEDKSHFGICLFLFTGVANDFKGHKFSLLSHLKIDVFLFVNSKFNTGVATSILYRLIDSNLIL